MDTPITSNKYLAAFFREFHRPRRRPMNWQARIAWYVDTTPQDVVRKTLDEMRQFKTPSEWEGSEAAAGPDTFSFFPQPLPDDPAYPAWLSRLADALEAEFHARLAHRACLQLAPKPSRICGGCSPISRPFANPHVS
jgi:hypothetical protein